jgi:hypothetical protein
MRCGLTRKCCRRVQAAAAAAGVLFRVGRRMSEGEGAGAAEEAGG